MTVEEFFGYLLKELETNPTLRGYYRFLNNPSSFEFRKAYYCQRLQYILDHAGPKGSSIWDIGCGYGTTGIFLALNGYKVHGSTLEYYFNEIDSRKTYWSTFGAIESFTADYENLYDAKPLTNNYDAVIVQDTLHHTEPIDQALFIIFNTLKPGGKMIAVEENGNNIVQNLKLYLRRGNKRIIEIEDKRLGKKILLGNENIKPFSVWKKRCLQTGFLLPLESVQYVRIFPPFMYNKNPLVTYEREQQLWRKSALLRELFFFGLNFCAVKPA